MNNLPNEVIITKEIWDQAERECLKEKEVTGYYDLGCHCPLNIALRPLMPEGQNYNIGIVPYGDIQFKINSPAGRFIDVFDNWLIASARDKPPFEFPVMVALK